MYITYQGEMDLKYEKLRNSTYHLSKVKPPVVHCTTWKSVGYRSSLKTKQTGEGLPSRPPPPAPLNHALNCSRSIEDHSTTLWCCTIAKFNDNGNAKNRYAMRTVCLLLTLLQVQEIYQFGFVWLSMDGSLLC